MKYETAGDPMTGLLWTKKTGEKIAKELRKLNIEISKTTVGKILKKMGYSLKCNSKKISNGGKKLSKQEKKDRDDQFLNIAKKRQKFEQKGLPTISIDGKKKELIGNFKNSGTRYKKVSDLTNDHDFCTYALGKAFPYGLFDPIRHEGFLYVGQSLWDKEEKKFLSSETPEFAAECVARWWKDYGMKRYPDADEILILADSGGSNGSRSRVWKALLYELLCKRYGLKVTVAHYPPGASKWNPIEHRMFSEITKNWSGTPLVNFETVIKYAKTTKTKTGLNVFARLIRKTYKKGKSVPDPTYRGINIKQDDLCPSLNYSLKP